MTSSWPLLEKARARSSPQPQQGSRFGAGVAELSVSMNLDVSEASTGGVDTMGDCSCLGDLEGVADDDDYGGGGGSGCVDADTGAGAGEMKRDTVGRLLALPEAILSEVLGEYLCCPTTSRCKPNLSKFVHYCAHTLSLTDCYTFRDNCDRTR